jgi:hypothetical protein
MLTVTLNTGWSVLIPILVIAAAAYRWGGWQR